MSKFFYYLSLVSFVVLVSIWQCDSFSNPDNKVQVMLEWYPNINHGPLLLAEEKGFFKNHSLQVKLLSPADPTEPVKLVAADKVDIAIDYLPGFVLAQQQGLPLRQIGSLINRPMGCLVVLKDSRITNIAQLRGKQIAYSSPAVDLLILKTILQTHGLKLSDVKPINVHYALAQALLSGKVDAAIGMMRNVEPNQLSKMNHPVTIFYPEENGVPKYDELIFVAKNTKNQLVYTQFMLALKEAVGYIKQHPDQAWADLIRAHPEFNTELNKVTWDQTISYFNPDPGKWDVNQTMKVIKWINAMH